MFKDFNKEAEQRLLQQKKETEDQLAKFGDRSQSQANLRVNFPQFGDREDENAEEVSAFGDRLSLTLSLEKRLAEIEVALAEIKAGTYGICQSCGAKIDKKRLEAFPTAKFCLVCKNKKQG